MASTPTTPTQTGIVLSTAITAGGWSLNHAEGIVVSTAITAAGIAVRTGIVAGPKRIFIGGLS